MHYLVRLLVPGETKEEAMENARSFADELCDQEYGADFDWNDFNGRWGDSKPYRLSTKAGQKHVDDAMKLTRSEFDRSLAHVRFMLDHFNDDQIFDEDFGTEDEQKEMLKDNKDIYYLSRYQFACVGSPGYTNNCFLYGQSYSRIENNKDYKFFIRNEDLKKLWVVPVDFHN